MKRLSLVDRSTGSKQRFFVWLLRLPVLAFGVFALCQSVILVLSPGARDYLRAEVYNSRAWLLVSSEDPAERDPGRGVHYARLAVTLTQEREPHSLDTLAWAYFHLGEFDKAEDAVRRSLLIFPDHALAKSHLERILEAKQEGNQPSGGKTN